MWLQKYGYWNPDFIYYFYRDGNNYKCCSNHIISYVVCMCMNGYVFKYSSSEGWMSNHLFFNVHIIHTLANIVNMTSKLKLLFHTARMFSMEIAVLNAVILVMLSYIEMKTLGYLKTSKWIERNPTKTATPAAVKGKKLWSKKRFERVAPEPELEDIIMWYRKY